MKKILPLILVIALCSTLCACNGTGADSSTVPAVSSDDLQLEKIYQESYILGLDYEQQGKFLEAIDLFKSIPETHSLYNGAQNRIAACTSAYQNLLAQNVETTEPVPKALQLLGEDSAFYKMYEAIQEDNLSYEDSLTDMMYLLTESFGSARLGTNVVQAAVSGLIPENIYLDAPTIAEKWDAIYKYAYTDKLCKYFEIDYASDGSPRSVNIRLYNIQAFVEDGISSGVFTGTSSNWEIDDSLEDIAAVCEKMNITREVAVVFLCIMDEYNAEWVAGNSDKMLDPFER